MWQAIVAVLSGVIDRRSRIAEAKAEAQIENAGKVIEASGWKDEFIVLIWSIPVILAFVPGMQVYVTTGFQNLKEAPEWYLVGWVSISLAIYGLKPATKKLIDWRKDK